jgi:hypothetical protein
MQPQLLPPARGGVSTELLDRTVGELCSKAYDLSEQLRRKKKANYRIDKIRDGTMVTSAVEAKISPQAFEGPPSSIQGSKVVVTIFGALTKTVEGLADERLVLEKAHVVCRY